MGRNRASHRTGVARWARPAGLGLAICITMVWGAIAYPFAQSGTQPAAAAGKAAPSPQTFVDVTQAVGVNFHHIAGHTAKKYLLETMGSGVGLFDFDNDGLLDIFFANGAPITDPEPAGAKPAKTGPASWNRLFHQKKDGTFEDVTEKAGLTGAGYSLGVAVGDYDNDGYEDLYVTGFAENHLYHNNGDGTFRDITAASGTGGSGWSTSAAWVDLDGDGLLDLVVLRYMKWDWDDVFCGEHGEGLRSYCSPDLFPAITPLVYHNDGNGHFSEQGARRGIAVPGKGLGIAIADYDRDGHIDLAIANDSMVEHLYRNRGDGTFEETGLPAGIAVDDDGRTFAGMGIAFGDFNNDGLPDLVITNLARQKYALYRNNGDGTFGYASYSSGLAAISSLHSGWGIAFLDYDNDGSQDLLVAQGHDMDNIELTSPGLHYREPLLLVRNNGKGFSDVSAASGEVFEQRWASRGMAFGDLFNDGLVDAVVSTNDSAAHVLRNQNASGNHWLGVALIGHGRSNRDAIGAEVKIVSGGKAQWATVSTTGSYLSANDKRLHFGLGVSMLVERMDIRWPDGTTQVLRNIPCDRFVTVDEARTTGEPPAVGKDRK
jgi:hypothetical protein